ncbi:MAG: histidine phosphatase family protein [Aquihabitans sp.]
MPRLHLVRHGRSEAAWDEHLDPGLHAEGRTQAVATAAELADHLAPIPIWSSPLRRALETAAPLAERWSTEVATAPAFGEIPSPTSVLEERRSWLAAAMVSNWADLGPAIDQWRSQLLGAVRSIPHDVVVFSHFVAANAVVGAAEGRPEVVVFAPAYASVTVIDVDSATGSLTVVERGSEATPEVG